MLQAEGNLYLEGQGTFQVVKNPLKGDIGPYRGCIQPAILNGPYLGDNWWGRGVTK